MSTGVLLSSAQASALPAPPSAPSKPPPSSLVGHEDLFAYHGLQGWARRTNKLVAHGAVTKGSVEHSLAMVGLPTLAGPVMPDGSPAVVHPNDSLLAMAFQAPGAPMAPIPAGRHALSDVALRALTFPSNSGGRGAGSGSLQLASRLDALVTGRTRMLEEDANFALARSRQAKRSKRESMGGATPMSDAYGAAAASAAASPGGWSGAGASPSGASASPSVSSGGAAASSGVNVFKLSLKRKVDDEGTGGSAYVGVDASAEGERKKKKKRVKDEPFEV